MSTRKSNLEDLAILGGTPSFQNKVHVGTPNLGNKTRFLERMEKLYQSRWLTNNGPFVQELESRIAEKLGVAHCIAMCNGTVALEIAIRACGLSGEVLVPSFTFIATAHALQWQQITPVFVDIREEDCTMDPEKLERLITPNTTGIIGVHLWGRPCQTEKIEAIAKKHRLKVIYDAAQAFLSSHQGRMIGSFGSAEVFSFHATKFFNTFEGGAVLTNDDALASKIRLMKNFGFSGYDRVIYLGTNGKMNEASAAMGLTLLEEIDSLLFANRENYETYRKCLTSIPGLRLLSYSEQEPFCNYQYITILLDEARTHFHRDHLLAVLHSENILARRYFYPGCHRMEPYRSYFPNAHLLLPLTEQMAQQVLVLPTGSIMTTSDIESICHIIRFVLQHPEAIKSRVAEWTRWEQNAFLKT